MTALKGGAVESFLRKPDPRCRVILVYGPDAGLVSERMEALAKLLVDDPSDPFQLVRLDGDDVAGDPLRLADEAHTVPLFGGRRAIRVRAGAKNLAPCLAPLLTTPPVDAFVVVEAGDLSPKNPVRSAVEASPNAAALPCYADETRDLPRIVDAGLAEHGLRIEEEARGFFISLLGADRLSTRSEIEKLALYARGTGVVRLADVEAVMADTAAVNLDAVVDSAFTGDAETLDSMLGRCLAEGSDAGMLVGAVLRHAYVLQKARIAIESGTDFTAAETAARMHFKRKDAFRRQLRNWSAAGLDEVIERLADAQATVRRNPRLAGAALSRALLGIALAAVRRG